MSKKKPKDRWPSIDDAYGLVLPSYEWSLRRFEALDARLRQIAMASATVTLGVPVAAGALASIACLEHWWLFWTGVGLGALVAVVALLDHTLKHLTLISLHELWQENGLGLPRWEFRKNEIYDAAKRQKKNGKIIEARGRHAIALALAFGVQVVVMAVWLGLNFSSQTCPSL